MASWTTQLIMRVHRFLYRISNGRIGSRLAGIPMLLLYTTGRKSGKEYIIPLAYHPHGDSFVVVASNDALPKHPGWYFNVMADDSAQVQAGDMTVDITARELTGDERQAIWKNAIKTNPAWARYVEKTDRIIPVVMLSPKS